MSMGKGTNTDREKKLDKGKKAGAGGPGVTNRSAKPLERKADIRTGRGKKKGPRKG